MATQVRNVPDEQLNLAAQPDSEPERDDPLLSAANTTDLAEKKAEKWGLIALGMTDPDEAVNYYPCASSSKSRDAGASKGPTMSREFFDLNEPYEDKDKAGLIARILTKVVMER